MTIHTEHPSSSPSGTRCGGSAAGSVGSVTLWTAGRGSGPADRAGLTVTSVLVALGEPPRLLALLDPDSDLADMLPRPGVAVVSVLSWEDRDLAEAFAGTAPAPGRRLPSGRVRADAVGAATGERDDLGRRTAGEHRRGRLVDPGDLRRSRTSSVGDDDPLVHRRGRYLRPAEP